MELEAVGGLALHIILTKVGPRDTARVACVSRKFRASASEDSLWFNFYTQDLHLSDPLDPYGNLSPSFKVAYQVWRKAFALYPWPLVLRVKRCWSRLENWLRVNFPEVEATLGKGASEADIQELENSLKVKLPIPTRLLYRFHNGQVLKEEEFTSSFHGSPLGLIGGYSFYEELVNVYLLPLNDVISETKGIMRHLGFSVRSKYILVAASSTFVRKIFFLNCTTGQLHVGTRNLEIEGEMMPCVPNELITSVHDFDSCSQQDAMLLWLEEHANRLENGFINVRDKEGVKSISLFPEEPPICSTAITHGVKVRASALFVPELTDLQHDSDKYFFTYSIRMSLQPEGCIINGILFKSCQLYWRRWIICANDVVKADVNGEAVIGQFPLLNPGEREFIYESCSSLESTSGSIEGSFTFIPGSLRDPKGSPFIVEVARFPLKVPDYIY